MKNILFVCTGNTCRSPMAQGIFEHICKERNLDYTCSGAGLATCTGLPVSENSAEALRQMGIDISHYRATSMADVNAQDFDLFAVMTPEHRDILRYYGVTSDKIYIIGEENGGISDPYAGSLARYIQCAGEIAKGIEELVIYLGERYGD